MTDWTWKDILAVLRIKNPTKLTKQGQEVFKSNEPLPQNIYEVNATHKQHAKKFHRMHYVFKYRLFQPIVMLFEMTIGKYLCYKPANVWHNKNILVFDDMFDVSVREWIAKYLSNTNDGMMAASKDKKSPETLDKIIKDHPSAKTLMSLKHIMVTMLLYDNAYKEFMNILMFNLTKGMNNAYKDHKAVKHLLYLHDNPFDVNYFLLGRILQEDKGKMPERNADGTQTKKTRVTFRDA